MIAAAIQKTSSGSNLGFGAFDLFVLGFIVFGFWRGRKNGMTKEVFFTPKWVVGVIASTLGYVGGANYLIQTGAVKAVFGTNFRESTAAYISSYVIILLGVFLIFAFIKKMFNEKVSGNNTFGSGEYYLGMICGVARYVCMIIIFLAILNAPVYSSAELQARKEYNNRWYGGGMEGYSGDFIPTVDELQNSVFKTSLIGRYVKDHFNFLLVKNEVADKPHLKAKQPTIHIGN